VTESNRSNLDLIVKRVRLPDGWRWVKLGQLCGFVNGDAYKPTDWSSTGVPIIRIQNLNDASKPFNYWAGSLRNRVVVDEGDILLAWSGTPGTSFGAHIWERGQSVLNQHIFRVDFKINEIAAEWFVFAVNHQLDFLIRKAHGGVGLRHVKKNEVESLEIPLPPLYEQKRIAAILNEQMSAVEKAQDATAAQLEAAKALPAAYLRTIFNSIEAQKWPTRRIGEVCGLLPSRSISTDGDAEVLAITTACLSETGFQDSGLKHARMNAKDSAECRVSPGEVLVARSNTPELVGRVAMFEGEPKEAVATDLTIRLFPSDAVIPFFLAACMSFLYLSGHWKERAGGASGSMKKITRHQIQEERVPVPSPQTRGWLPQFLKSRWWRHKEFVKR